MFDNTEMTLYAEVNEYEVILANGQNIALLEAFS